MKRNDFLKFTSVIGFTILYAITVVRILKRRQFKLFFELFLHASLLWFGFLIIPIFLLMTGIEVFFYEMSITKNILYCVLWVLIYLLGVVITHELLIWQQRRLR